MTTKEYRYLIDGNRVQISKIYRTRTQYEYYLEIFMGDSDWESILIYEKVWLTRKSALNHAKHVILNAPQPRIEKVGYYPINTSNQKHWQKLDKGNEIIKL
jgi:hypothetical protein